MSDVLTLFRSKKTEDRIRAISLVHRLTDAERQGLLVEALHDKSNYVATLAAETLGELADENAADAMQAHFLYLMEDGPTRDPGCHIRSHLAFAFGRLEYRPAADALRQGICAEQVEGVGGTPFDTAAHLRANCALALAQMRAPDALRDIALLLFDMRGLPRQFLTENDPIVRLETRKAAAQALARLADADALVPLAVKLKFPEEELPDVLQECMQAVVELEDPRALEVLTPYLHHRDGHLAAYAALMIAQTRAPEAPELLRDTAERQSGDALRAILLALTTLRSDAARDVLDALAETSRDEVRLAAVEALAGLRDTRSEERLRAMAKNDRSAKVRTAAKNAID